MKKDYLEKILAGKRREIAQHKRLRPLEQLKKNLRPSTRSFCDAIRGKDNVSIIAEIKQASPSQGNFNCRFTPPELFEQYLAGGAAAISILTEKDFFHGSLDILKEIDSISNLPLLRKDFIIDPYQIYEARAFGADAILLIANILSADEIKSFSAIAASLGMGALIEVHTAEEMKKVLSLTPAHASHIPCIGINARNLESFEVDIDAFFALASLAPKSAILVAESGIRTKDDLARYTGKADAALIGETLVLSTNPAETLRALTS